MDADKSIELDAVIIKRELEEGPVKCKCNRCGWKWMSKPRPTSPRPSVCPHCHSYLWNRAKPKRAKKAGKMGKKK